MHALTEVDTTNHKAIWCYLTPSVINHQKVPEMKPCKHNYIRVNACIVVFHICHETKNIQTQTYPLE